MSGNCGICRQSGHIYRHCQSPIIDEKKTRFINSFKERLREYSSNFNNQIQPNEVLPGSIQRFNSETSFENAKEIMLGKRRSSFTRYKCSIYYDLKRQMTGMPIRLLQLIFPEVLHSLMNEFSIPLSAMIYSHNTQLNINNINSVRFNTKTEYQQEVSNIIKTIMYSLIPNNYFDYSNVIESDLIRPPPRDMLAVRLIGILDGVIGDTNLINNSQKDSIVSLIKAHYKSRETGFQRENFRLERKARRYRESLLLCQRELAIKQQSTDIKFLMDSSETEYIKEDICPICTEELDACNTVALSCNHTFCSGCTGQFIKSCNGNCPICRAQVKEIHFKKNININDYNALVNYLY